MRIHSTLTQYVYVRVYVRVRVCVYGFRTYSMLNNQAKDDDELF